MSGKERERKREREWERNRKSPRFILDAVKRINLIHFFSEALAEPPLRS